MAGLLDVHCSEYLREVAAALLVDPSSSGSAKSVVSFVATRTTDDTTGTSFASRTGLGAIAAEVVQLRRVLTFHSSLSAPNCADECRSRVVADSQFGGSRDCRLLAEVGAAVHSASVHAHAAARAAAALDGFLATAAEVFRRTPQSPSPASDGVGRSTNVQLTAAVSHESASNQPYSEVAAMTMESLQSSTALAEEAHSQLADVRRAAAASLACCDHGLSLATQILNRDKTQAADRCCGDTSPCEEDSDTAAGSYASLEKARHRRLLVDTPLTDEFFEAYAADCPEQDVSSSDGREARAGRGEAGGSHDAKNAAAAATAARTHLLRELKSVVGALAAEWQEREARAAATVRDCRSSASDAAAELCRLADAARAAVEGRDIRKLAATASVAAAASEVPAESSKVTAESSKVTAESAKETVATAGDRDSTGTTSDVLKEGSGVVELQSAAVAGIAVRAPAACPDPHRFTDEEELVLQREQMSGGFDVFDLRRVAAEVTQKSLSFRTNFGEATFQDGESDSESDGVDSVTDSE